MNIPAHFEFFSPRKLPVLALGIVLSLGATISHLSAQTLFSDNFSSYGTPGTAGVNIAPGSPLPAGSTYTGTGLVFNTGTATGTDALAGAAFGGGPTNNFAKAGIGGTAATNTNWVLTDASKALSLNQTINISFNFYAVANTGGISFNIYNQEVGGTFATGRGAGVFLNTDTGVVQAYDGNSIFTPSGSGTFSRGVLQTFSMTINFASNTFSYNVNGVTNVSPVAFKGTVDDLKSVLVNTSTSSFYYDNLTIAVVPEPSTAGLALGALALIAIATKVRRSKLA